MFNEFFNCLSCVLALLLFDLGIEKDIFLKNSLLPFIFMDNSKGLIRLDMMTAFRFFLKKNSSTTVGAPYYLANFRRIYGCAAIKTFIL